MSICIYIFCIFAKSYSAHKSAQSQSCTHTYTHTHSVHAKAASQTRQLTRTHTQSPLEFLSMNKYVRKKLVQKTF